MRVLLLALPLALPPGDGAADKLYARAVQHAVERAQKELFAGVHFEVDHSVWDNPWVVTSAHYEVRTTHSYAQAAEISNGLELLYAEWTKLLGEGPAHAGLRRVWIFPGMADYNKFGTEAGAEHSSLTGCFFSDKHAEQPVATYQNGNPKLIAMWATHGAVHQYLLQRYGEQHLTWVDEGLAAYFALFWDWDFATHEFARIVRGPTYVPLERLVSEPIQAYKIKPEDRFIELGLLFRYLLNSCEATRNGAGGDPTTGPFQEFLRAAVRGQDVSETEFMQGFEEGAALLEEDFKSFDFSKQ